MRRWSSSSARARAASRVSVGLLGNACEVLPELLRRGVRPDAVTDQTSAHDPVNGYLPAGWSLEKWDRLRDRGSRHKSRARRAPRWRAHVEAMLAFQELGIPVFDYGNNLRQMAFDEGRQGRLRFSRLRARVRPAAVLPRRGALPLGGAVRGPGGYRSHRCEGASELLPERCAPASLARHGARAHPVPGAAGAHLLGGAR